jgi:tetratricopeptide (TPR) repeat protein
MTANKMPRWLSEGISVFEESQSNPSWGQRMNPQYRSMILGGELTPVSKLSGAFLTSKSPLQLQFAYYESSLVVEYIVNRFGVEKLKSILRDLHEGTDINTAVANHTSPMATLEKDFKEFAVQRAKDLAPGLEWDKPDSSLVAHAAAPPAPKGGKGPGRLAPKASPGAEAELTKWAEAHPKNFWALTYLGDQLMADKKWQEATVPLERLVEAYPNQTGSDSAYRSLAIAYRQLGMTEKERKTLAKFAEVDDEAKDAYLRLMDLSATANDWSAVTTNADRFLAVDPLIESPYQFLAKASETNSDYSTAIGAYDILLKLDPANPADVHFQLARLLEPSDAPTAKRHTLLALEEEPRHRAALKLLLKLKDVPAPESPSAKESKTVQ